MILSMLNLISVMLILVVLCLKVTDITRPLCQVVHSSTNCPSSSSLCASSHWQFIANLTDGINGTGIESVTVHQGNGTLNTSTVVGAGGENITVATYSASCCSQKVELAAVDTVGNAVLCVGKAGQSIAASTMSPAAVSKTSTVVHLGILHYLWISVAVISLWN